MRARRASGPSGAACRQAYLRDDRGNDRWEEIKPRALEITILPASQFGDDGDEKLDDDQCDLATRYFQAVQYLSTPLDFINVRVGGQDNFSTLIDRNYNRGVTFEAPPNAQMTAIKYEVCEDMGIANFMKTALHGDSGPSHFCPNFTPYVATSLDNGLAKRQAELAHYFKTYRDRTALDYLKRRFEGQAKGTYRKYVPDESLLHKSAKQAYGYCKKTLR